MSALAQILRSIQSNAVQLVIAAVAANNTKIIISVIVAGAALLVINCSAQNPAIVIHSVIANLCTPIVVAQINCICIVAILAADGLSPDTIAFHMCTQHITSINYVCCIITPGKHSAGGCRSCALHQRSFVIAGNINTAAADKAANATIAAVKFHIAKPTGNAGRCQAGANHSLTGQVFINTCIAIVNFLCQCLEGCFNSILVISLDVFAICCRNQHRTFICFFNSEIAALVITYISACIIMVIAYDMSTAEAAYGNCTGIRCHADKAVNRNFYFLVIAAVRVDIFNSLNNTLAAF